MRTDLSAAVLLTLLARVLLHGQASVRVAAIVTVAAAALLVGLRLVMGVRLTDHPAELHLGLTALLVVVAGSLGVLAIANGLVPDVPATR